MLAVLLVGFAQDLVIAQDGSAADAAMARYREETRFVTRCEQPRDDGEITVCSRRDADNYRLPLIASRSPAASAPMREERLTRDYGQMDCGQGALFHRCGMVGVTVRSSGGRIGLVERELAP
jgi:hypothetical protein